MSGIRFVPFTDEGESLAAELHELVRANANILRRDFPLVVHGYRTLRTARATVAEVVATMHARGGEFGAFAVRQNDRLIGVATYEQMRLALIRGWGPFRYRKVAVEGPHLTLWLGEHHQPLLGAILHQAAYVLRKIPALAGWAHTLVRSEQRLVQTVLSDVNNGFGGFRVLDNSARWDGDGVTGPRRLMVARLAVCDLPIDRRR